MQLEPTTFSLPLSYSVCIIIPQRYILFFIMQPEKAYYLKKWIYLTFYAKKVKPSISLTSLQRYIKYIIILLSNVFFDFSLFPSRELRPQDTSTKIASMIFPSFIIKFQASSLLIKNANKSSARFRSFTSSRKCQILLLSGVHPQL